MTVRSDSTVTATGWPARLRGVAGLLLAAVAVLLAGTILAPALMGYERYVITGGSMGRTIPRGSVIYGEVVPTTQLRVGDVITYTPPRGAGPRGLVTHRIARIGRDRDGRPVYRTRGDGNRSVDPWTFQLGARTQARVAFHLPYLGYGLAALGDRRLRMLVIGVPALLIGLAVLAGMWRDAGVEARRRAAAAPDGPLPESAPR